MATNTIHRRSERAAVACAQLLPITVLLLSVAAGTAAQSLGPNEQTKSVIAALVRSFNDKDAARVAAFYSADAYLLAPGVPLIKGHTEIKAYFEQLLNGGAGDLALSPLETTTAFNAQFVFMLISFELGLQHAVTEPHPDNVAVNGEVRRIKGKGLVLFRREGGEWKIASSSFNTDEPLVEARRPTNPTR